MTRPRTLNFQTALTVGVELLVAASAFLVLRLAAREFGPQGFGEFVAARRGLALIQLPLLMGLGIALPRFAALHGSRDADTETAHRHGFAGLLLGLLPSLTAATAILLAPGPAARLLFEDRALVTLSAPVALGLLGVSANTLSTAALRGHFALGYANLLQLAVMAVLPVVVFATKPAGAAQALWLQGLIATLIAGLAWCALLYRAIRGGGLRHGWPSGEARQLLRYGISRIPGEFALAALFSLPTLILIRSRGVAAAGQLSFALSVVTLFATAFAPIGLVLLPAASRLAGQGDHAGLRRLARRLALFGLPLAAVGVIVAWPLARWFTIWYLGPAFEEAVPLVRLGLLGVVPYVVYILFRNLLDAMDVRPINSRNLLVALVLTILPTFLWRSAEALALSTVGGLVLLGLLTGAAVRSCLRQAACSARSSHE